MIQYYIRTKRIIYVVTLLLFIYNINVIPAVQSLVQLNQQQKTSFFNSYPAIIIRNHDNNNNNNNNNGRIQHQHQHRLSRWGLSSQQQQYKQQHKRKSNPMIRLFSSVPPDADWDNVDENNNSNDDDNEFPFAPREERNNYESEGMIAEKANEMIATQQLDSNDNERIMDRELYDEISTSFLQYSMSIIMGRAIPDARDGLKPVHRRILYSMDQLRLYSTSSHRKCARVVGDVLGKYHPHGDIAIYDSLVRMAQTFITNHVLIDGYGNFGSIDNDPAAAMRYTECRLTSFTKYTLLDDQYDDNAISTNDNNDVDGDNNYSIVDFVPNFDGNEIEPTILPAKVPLLLLNGGSGIAVGMATNIPPHNLKELMNACIYMVQLRQLQKEQEREITDAELLNIIPGPDFPTAALMIGTEGVKQLYTTGHGSIILRAVTHVEAIPNSMSRNAIIITELPYQVNKSLLLEKIAALVNDKKLDGISDLRDESDRDGIRIVIELKRDAVTSVVLKNLYIKTSLQTSFAGNFLALFPKKLDIDKDNINPDNNKNIDDVDDTIQEENIVSLNDNNQVIIPQRFTLKKALDCFLDFRFITIRRKTKNQLMKVQYRIMIVNGLLIALTDIDKVIQIIRTSNDNKMARIAIQKHFNITTIQIDSILKLQLGQLTKLNKEKLVLEKEDLLKRQIELINLLNIDNNVYDTMLLEFNDIINKYGRDRKTIILSPNNNGNNDVNGDYHDISNISDMDLIKNSRSIIVMTHGGYIKRLPLKTFERVQGRGTRGKRGTVASTESNTMTTPSSQQQEVEVEEEDVAHCFSCNDHDLLLMVTQNGIGYGIRAYQIPVVGRTARGKPIPSVLPAMNPTDIITSVVPIVSSSTSKQSTSNTNNNDDNDSDDSYLLFATEYGWIKRTPISSFDNISTNRGLIVSKLDSGDKLKWCQQVTNDDDILIGTSKGMATRFSIKEIRPTARSSRGVRAMILKVNDTIADVNILRSNINNNMVSKEEKEYALIVTSNGYGKRVPTSEFARRSRGCKGVIATKFKKRQQYNDTNNKKKNNNNQNVIDDQVSCLLTVGNDPNQEIIVMTAKGLMLRQKVINIPSQSRSATGVTIQKLNDGDHIISVSIVPTYEEAD